MSSVHAARQHWEEGNRRLEEADTPEALARRARKLGLVRTGEQLFIVKGIEEWRRKARTRIGGDG